MELTSVKPSWVGYPCIVAAPGPSLTEGVARFCRIKRLTDNWKILVVQDACRRFPYADALYGCDNHWWAYHKDFNGAKELWSTHEQEKGGCNDKRGLEVPGLLCVRGMRGCEYSSDPSVIRYGGNSGFQALSLAILKGCTRIVLVGFDMRYVEGKAHFFGDHPKELHQNTKYESFAEHFARAKVPQGVSIVNATPNSALTCFPMMSLEDALANGRMYRDGSESHARTGTDGA